MNNDDFLVPPKSAKAIEIKALDFGQSFGVEDHLAPDVIDLIREEATSFFPTIL